MIEEGRSPISVEEIEADCNLVLLEEGVERPAGSFLWSVSRDSA